MFVMACDEATDARSMRVKKGCALLLFPTSPVSHYLRHVTSPRGKQKPHRQLPVR